MYILFVSSQFRRNFWVQDARSCVLGACGGWVPVSRSCRDPGAIQRDPGGFMRSWPVLRGQNLGNCAIQPGEVVAFYNIKRKEVRGGRMSQAAKLSIVGRHLSQMGSRSNNTLRGPPEYCEKPSELSFHPCLLQARKISFRRFAMSFLFLGCKHMSTYHKICPEIW